MHEWLFVGAAASSTSVVRVVLLAAPHAGTTAVVPACIGTTPTGTCGSVVWLVAWSL